MTLEKAHIAVGIISTVISIVASLIVYAVTFGEMRSEVRHLKSKVAALEDKLTNSQVANDPTKVSVCDDLFGELRSSLSSVVRSDEEAIRAEIKK